MLNIPFPYKFFAGLMIGVMLWTGYSYSVKVSYKDGWNAAIEHVKNADNQALLIEQSKVNKLQSKINSMIEERNTERAKEKEQYETQIANANDRIRAGTERLSCPRSAPAPATSAPAHNTGAASGPAAENGTYLLPETSIDVLSIASADYRNVQSYNEVVKLYNEMRAVCNGNSTQ